MYFSLSLKFNSIKETVNSEQPCKNGILKKAFQQNVYCLLALTVSASTATRCQYQWGRGLEVNKFEQVSSDGHQMSLVGG